MTSKSELKRQNIMRGRPMMEGIAKVTKLETLRSLQKRIREATGPDREFDLAIGDALLPGKWRGEHRYDTPRFTTDPDGLGACVALQRTVLPGWVRDTDATRPSVGIVVTLWPDERILWTTHKTATHAIENHAHLSAIIAARIAEIEAKEKADV